MVPFFLLKSFSHSLFEKYREKARDFCCPGSLIQMPTTATIESQEHRAPPRSATWGKKPNSRAIISCNLRHIIKKLDQEPEEPSIKLFL